MDFSFIIVALKKKLYFEEEDNLVEMVNEKPKDTQLTVFYNLNHNKPNGPNKNLTYVDFPDNFDWKSKQGIWTERRNQIRYIKTEIIGHHHHFHHHHYTHQHRHPIL